MTWDAYNRRKAALREIFTIVDRRRDLTPTELLDRVDPAREAFDDESLMILEVQLAWFQRLSGTLDRMADDVDGTPEDIAIAAWVDAAAEMPGARALLDAHLDEEILTKGLTNERTLMAAVAGVPIQRRDAAAAAGADIIDRARQSAVYPIRTDNTFDANDEARPAGLVARLRSVLAA